MNKLKAVIIEDEELLAQSLQDKLQAVAPDVQVTEVLPSLKTTRKWLLNNAEPDLLFMDIQLSDGISFQIFDEFTLRCPVIFTTAYDEYAIRAFKVNSVDYLLKPVNLDELKAAVDKAREAAAQKNSRLPDMQQLLQALNNPQSIGNTYKEKFIANVRNQWMPVNTSDIACFVKAPLIYIYLLNGEKYLVDYESLDEVEDLLNPKKFYRANRQTIINIEAVQTVKTQDNSKLTLRLKAPLDKLEIDMSRLKAPDFKKWLER